MKGRTYDDAAIVLAEEDTVATALADLEQGRRFDIDGRTVELTEPVEFGHKFALEPIKASDRIIKYDEVIGEATASIDAGEWVHTHNVESTRARPDGDDTALEADGE